MDRGGWQARVDGVTKRVRCNLETKQQQTLIPKSDHQEVSKSRRVEKFTKLWSALVIANTFFQQHKRRLYTWTSPGGQHRNQIDNILCSQRWRNSIQLAKTKLGAGCGSDHELLIAKFTLKLKKVGKTTRPFRYEINQIPNDYTVEVEIDCRD